MAENVTPSPLNPAAFEAARAQLLRGIRSSGNWFYWIAGLSFINTLIITFGGDISFIVGLGITQLADAASAFFTEGAGQPTAGIISTIFLVIDLLVMGVFAFFGYHAGKARTWAFITGMVLYALDGLLFILMEDWLSLVFHLFVLWQLFTGIQRLNKLKQLEKMVQANTTFTQV